MVKKFFVVFVVLTLSATWWYAHHQSKIPTSTQPESSNSSPASGSNAAPEQKSSSLPQSLEIKRNQDMSINVQEIITPSGLKIWFLPNNSIDVFSVAITLKGGGERSCPKDQQALAEILASLLDEGYGEYSSRDFKELLLENNITLSASSNSDNLVIKARTTKDKAGILLKIMKGILTKARFDEGDLTRIKQQTLSSLSQSLFFPGTVAKEELFKAIIVLEHPYVKSAQKALQFIPTITPEQLKVHLKKIVNRNQILFAVSGNIEGEELGSLVEENFKDLPAFEGFAESKAAINPQTELVFKEMNVPQTVILFAAPALDNTHPDFFAYFLANHILGGNVMQCRLWDEVREKRGLTYNISTQILNGALVSALIGSTSTKTQSAKETIELIKSVWCDFFEKGITQEELEAARDNLIGAFPLSFSSSLTSVSVMANLMASGFPVTYFKERANHFQGLTLEQVNEAIRNHLDPSKLTFIQVGNKEGYVPVQSGKD